MRDFGIVFIALFIIVTLDALLLMLAGLFPRTTDSTREIAEQTPGRSFLLGFVNIVFLGAVTVASVALAENLKVNLLIVPGVIALILAAITSAFGLAGVTVLIGERLFPDHGRAGRNLRGGAALILGSLTPYVGWFGLFPYVVMLGTGALIISLFQRLQSPGAEKSKKKM
jgi:hypothetical protein